MRTLIFLSTQRLFFYTLKMTEIYDFKTELYNPNKYNEDLVQINNHVYISILSAKSKTNHNKPCVLYGYGSYGVNLEPSFDPAIISLLDRGYYYCIAHIRGSSIDGYSSWLAGKMLNKKKMMPYMRMIFRNPTALTLSSVLFKVEDDENMFFFIKSIKGKGNNPRKILA